MRILIVEDETAAFENLKARIHEINPFIEIMGNTESIAQTIKWLSKHLPQRYPDKLLIPLNNELIPVDISQISYFYTTVKCTRTILKDNTGICYMKALDRIYSTLNPEMFFRANKQFVIAKSSIKNITIWSDSRLLITMDNETPERIFISKNRASQFKNWFTGRNKTAVCNLN